MGQMAARTHLGGFARRALPAVASHRVRDMAVVEDVDPEVAALGGVVAPVMRLGGRDDLAELGEVVAKE